jgi:tetratricopeptide (TPR) repeat protein
VDVQELKTRARAAVVKGRLEQAEVLYRQVLTRVPRDAPAWLRHAETLRRLDRVNDAVWSYRTASTILLALGHEARAVAGLKLALELKPDDVDLVTEIIRVELHRHRRSGPPATPSRPTQAVVTLEEMERPQLALPVLGPVDLRPSADSAVTPAPAPADAPPTPRPPHAHAMEGLLAAALALADVSWDTLVPSSQPDTGGPADPSEPLDVGPVAAPPPRPVAAAAGLETSSPLPAPWPQLRRVSARELAIKPSKDGGWIVITAQAPLEVRFVESLELDPDQAPPGAGVNAQLALALEAAVPAA